MEYFFSGRWPVKGEDPNVWATDLMVVTSIVAKDEKDARLQMRSQLEFWLKELDTAHLVKGKIHTEQILAEPISL